MAAITAGVIAAGSAIASSKMQSDAIKKAGRQQKSAADAATLEQRRQFDLSREDFKPFLEQGGAASEQLGAFLGLQGQEAEQKALAGFNESPGQAFLRERQERSLLRNEAALGGLGGGNVRTALQEQAFGIASQQLGERKDRLQQVAQLGAGAAGQIGGIGQATGANIAQTQLRAGDAAAANTLGLAQNRASGLSNVAGAFTGSGGIFQNRDPIQEIDLSTLPQPRR